MVNTETCYLTKWQRRAQRVGYMVLRGQNVLAMTDKQIEAAFDTLSRDYGLSYAWGD